MTLYVLSALFGLGALCGCGYYALCWVAAQEFLRERVPEAATFPGVSLLKPMKGMDPELYESLRSHCLQDYPAAYEIVFGVCDLEDAAVEYVRRLQGEFPERAIELVVCPEASATNRKVGNLAQMLPRAKYDVVVVNDSDIRVSAKYLRNIAAEFASVRTGMVTALYRAVPGATVWSRVEALGVSTDFGAGVLAARKVEGGVRFGLGSTLAMRREALAAIGGFTPLFDYLGDDYELGARIAAAGYEVKLAHEVVETFLPAYSFRGFFQHQLRWARAIRDSRPRDYVGMAATFGLPWAMLCVLFASGSWWSWLLLVITATLRFAMAWQVSQRVLNDPYGRRDMWMVPLRDVLAVCVWAASFFGKTIVWRGERFRLRKGKLSRTA